MLVNATSGVKVLRTSTGLDIYVGTLDMDSVRECIDADVLEVCETTHGDFMLIDEEGKLKEKRLNLRASRIYKYAHDMYGSPRDYIVGDAVVVPKKVYAEWTKERMCEDED